jgi:hypothetical protein
MLCRLNGSRHSSHRSVAVIEVGQLGDQTALRGGEEGASQDIRGICGDNRLSSFTTLDNVLTIGELAMGENRDGQPHPHAGDLLEEAEGSVKITSHSSNLAKAHYQ